MLKLFIYPGVFAACLFNLKPAGLVKLPAFALTPTGCCPSIRGFDMGVNMPLMSSTSPACRPCVTCQ